ncbi:transposase [Clostridium botulinum]|nr:transposase [Clostridium botulinum]NFP01726.1 transposase [Clostridium botulinum]
MFKIYNLKEGIKTTNKIINDIMFLYDFRSKKTYFTRMGRSKMNFNNIILFILNFVKKTLQIELDNFFKKVHKNDITITKQAFSQARRKVLPGAFIYLLDKINEGFYSVPFKKYSGYRLLAIDDTVLQLHNSEELKNTYGYIENQNDKVARARASALYDIENDMIVASKLEHYRIGERETAEKLLNKLCELGKYNDLILFDRGYPSKDFIEFIETKNLKYEYKVNTNILIGKFKDTLITLIAINNPWKRSRMLKFIQEEIERNVIPIRPDRTFERKENRNTQMINRMNKKRAL